MTAIIIHGRIAVIGIVITVRYEMTGEVLSLNVKANDGVSIEVTLLDRNESILAIGDCDVIQPSAVF